MLALEQVAELGEGVQFEQVLTLRRGCNVRVLQNPGAGMKEKDGVQAGGQGRVDVALRAVADHPTGVGREFVALENFAIGGRVLFCNDFDGGEVAGESGAGQLVGLFRLIALGHEDETVAGGQFGESFFHAGEQLDLLFLDRAGKAENALGLFFRDRRGAETLKTRNQGPGKAGQAVAMGQNGFALHGVEGLAHFGRRVLVVVQVADERGDGALEVDVVFPQRIVGVNEQGLA